MLSIWLSADHLASHSLSLPAEVLAREIVGQVTGKNLTEYCILEVKRSRYIPPPEPVTDVPQKYFNLGGNHAPHRGTGKGKAYQRDAQQGDGASASIKDMIRKGVVSTTSCRTCG